MTERNPALWMQNRADHTAEQERALLTIMFGGAAGVTDAASLAVTQSGTPAMSVSVAAGTGIVQGTSTAAQGAYGVWNDAAKTVTITAADGSNPRRDIIVARIKDSFYSGADNTFTIEVITGTPAASPVDPTIPASCLQLARVAVAASATSITNANITDLRSVLRPWNTGWGRVGRATSSVDTTNANTNENVYTPVAATFTAETGRRYRITANILVRNVAATTNDVTVRLKDGTSLLEARLAQVAALFNLPFVFTTEVTGLSAGSHTINLTMQGNQAAGVALRGTLGVCAVTVDDVGPA